jgi:quercetin dioxygenase-like cupin family protein
VSATRAVRSWLDAVEFDTRRDQRRRQMEIKQCGSQPSGKGPSERFTGTVRINPLFDAPDPQRVLGASVTFEPGVRTPWHTHPLG